MGWFTDLLDVAKPVIAGGEWTDDLKPLVRLAVGSDVTDEAMVRHFDNKWKDIEPTWETRGGKAGYKHQKIKGKPVSDALDGYHIKAGKDFGELASGDLRGGGIPAALAAIAYQRIDEKIKGNSSESAWLQAMDNITGLRESGNAPYLDALANDYARIANIGNNFNSPDYKVDRRGRRLDSKGLFNTQGKNFIKDKTKEIRKDAWDKVLAVTKAKDKDGNLSYPNVDKDLLQHYFMSQNLRFEQDILGMEVPLGLPLSLALGLGKEIADGTGLFNTKGSASGFSVDDLGADWVGATDMPFDEAYARGMFKHTETKGNIKGFGQGEWRKVLKKLDN
jgi:hypothetical protein